MQLNEYFLNFNILNPKHSCFRKYNSTETLL